jgi:DNA-binding MarR family transcriptional regulator
MVKRLTNPLRERPTPLGSLLNAAATRLSAELDGALRAAGFDDVRAAHAPVFMAIEPDGSRVTDLAHRAAMSKQAIGELIRHLESRGYITVRPDPTDRRAKRVQLTERGWETVDLGERVIAEFDAWLEQAIGPDQVAQLRQTLERIVVTEPRHRTPTPRG